MKRNIVKHSYGAERELILCYYDMINIPITINLSFFHVCFSTIFIHIVASFNEEEDSKTFVRGGKGIKGSDGDVMGGRSGEVNIMYMDMFICIWMYESYMKIKI
jgi:hypothetical protein